MHLLTRRDWKTVVASAAIMAASSSSLPAADDVFVRDGVVVKPLPKWKQKRLERKLTKNPGNEIVIEQPPAIVAPPAVSVTRTGPGLFGGIRTRRSFKPVLPSRGPSIFGPEVDVVSSSPTRTIVTTSPPKVVAPSIVSGPTTIVSTPRIRTIAPDDPLVIPGSTSIPAPVDPLAPAPIISKPGSRSIDPVDPDEEPTLESLPSRPVQVVPPPAEEIPPVVSTPARKPVGPKPATGPAPTPEPVTVPVPEPASGPDVDPGPPPLPAQAAPTSTTPPSAEPSLELPVTGSPRG